MAFLIPRRWAAGCAGMLKAPRSIGLGAAPRPMATVATFKIPKPINEPNKTYAKGSPERDALSKAIQAFDATLPLDVPYYIDGKALRNDNVSIQFNPARHAQEVARFSNASADDVQRAIEVALGARQAWSETPFADRAAIFLKAADLISGKYRYQLMAATMVGQGKNAYQAEIDAAAELCDFLRFNVQYAEEMYAQQPAHHSPGVWNRLEYRPLEGFTYAITPFNFTAIAGNLPTLPALLGNVVIWKPSPSAIASNHLLYRILLEAGLPPNVIQFLPGDAEEVTQVALAHPALSALHYTGSTAVFRALYGRIAAGVANARYHTYPRVVGETGGKNFHLIHPSAPLRHAVVNTVRAAFEYQGQKCSACSRAYIPASLWPAFKHALVAETRALSVGPPENFANLVGPVIHRAAFDRLHAAIDAAKADPTVELLAGGTTDASTGYYVHPTLLYTTDPRHDLLTRELFGPVLALHVYDDAAEPWAAVCARVAGASGYALTGAVFAQDRAALRIAEDALRDAAGNFYVNVKATGAVVGQQAFGGARASGTNDKAGSAGLLGRFVSVRAIKEQMWEDGEVGYVSNT